MIESTIYTKGFPKGFTKAFKKKTDIKANIIAMFEMIFAHYIQWDFKDEQAKDEIESDIIEKLLFEDGRAMFFKYGGHYFTTLIAQRGKIDANARLTKAHPITLDGNIYPERVIRRIVEQKGNKINIIEPDAVILKNNMLDLPTITILDPFINTLNYIWQTLQINLSNNRVKRIIKATDPNQVNIIKREINNLIDGVESISVITDKNAVNGIETLESASTSQDIKDIREVYDWLYNWLLTYLGIDNMAQIDKQSGMTPDEINANKSQTNLYLSSMLEYRKKACDQINKIYNIGASITTLTEKQAREMQQEIINRFIPPQDNQQEK